VIAADFIVNITERSGRLPSAPGSTHIEFHERWKHRQTPASRRGWHAAQLSESHHIPLQRRRPWRPSQCPTFSSQSRGRRDKLKAARRHGPIEWQEGRKVGIELAAHCLWLCSPVQRTYRLPVTTYPNVTSVYDRTQQSLQWSEVIGLSV